METSPKPDLTALSAEAERSLSEVTAVLPPTTVEAMHPTDFTSEFQPGQRRSAFPERGALPMQPKPAEVADTMDRALAEPVIIQGDNSPSPEIDEEQKRWNAFARGEDVDPKTT